jgi:hypothetical protein
MIGGDIEPVRIVTFRQWLTALVCCYIKHAGLPEAVVEFLILNDGFVPKLAFNARLTEQVFDGGFCAYFCTKGDSTTFRSLFELLRRIQTHPLF